jgi:hypothetical protein
MIQISNLLGIIDDGRSLWAVTTISSVVFLCGLLWRQPALLGGGAVALCLVVRSWGGVPSPAHSRRRQSPASDSGVTEHVSAPSRRPYVGAARPTSIDGTGTTDGLVEEMLSDRRYGLLLHPETSRHLRREQIIRAIRMLDDEMALVPAGRVLGGHGRNRMQRPSGKTRRYTPTAPLSRSRQPISIASPSPIASFNVLSMPAAMSR